MWDVVTFGETMLRLTPPDFRRLEQASSFTIEVGGSESNAAAGLARLGQNVLWISRLTKNPLGEKIARTIASHGVDTSQIIWTDQDRIGTYYYEEGSPPRTSFVVYDRKDSAASKIKKEDFPAGLFRPDAARLLHFCGITPALSKSAFETCLFAAEQAKKCGWLFSFDINYRAKLWSPSAAREAYEQFFEFADLVFAPQRDLQMVFDLESKDPPKIFENFQKKIPRALPVMTSSTQGAYSVSSRGELLHVPIFPSSGIGRLGGGDSFSAGFLASYLEGPTDISRALRWGAAAAALKYSTPGDMPCFTRQEVLNLAETTNARNNVLR